MMHSGHYPASPARTGQAGPGQGATNALQTHISVVSQRVSTVPDRGLGDLASSLDFHPFLAKLLSSERDAMTVASSI